MDVESAIIGRRSIRRFKQIPIPLEFLKKLVNAARLAPSGANLQPLEYIVINDQKLCDKIFPALRWAGYIKPEWKPDKEERPTAYIVILVKKGISQFSDIDVGLAAENIMILAYSYGIGSCMLGNIDRDFLRDILNIPPEYHIHSVIALGFPAEKSVAEDAEDSIRYWRDKDGVMHVPKRKLENILHINRF